MVVVEVAGIVVCSVVVVLWVVSPFFSFTVVQADSDTKATAARQRITSFFISSIFLFGYFTCRDYAVVILPAMGSNPTSCPAARNPGPVRSDVKSNRSPKPG